MWFLIIDSRSYMNTVNLMNVENLEETKDGRLTLVYFIADQKQDGKFNKKQEIYDCCENELILRTWMGARKRVVE